MKRYGDNLPPSNKPEDELENQPDRNAQVMYGGCGVRFGTFSKPVEHAPKRKTLDLLSLFGLKRKKANRSSN